MCQAFESADGEFVLYMDGSWDAMQDGVRVHGSAFTTFDMDALAEDLIRVERSRVGMHDNDRTGEQ